MGENDKEMVIWRSVRIFLEELRKELLQKIDKYFENIDTMVINNLKMNGSKFKGMIDDEDEVVSSEVILNRRKEENDEKNEASSTSGNEAELKRI